MNRIKKNLLVGILSCLMLCITSCKSGSQKIDNKQKFESDVKSIISIISNNINNNENKEIGYVVYGDYITSSDNINYDISSYNISTGILHQNENGEIYASLTNNEFCAIKDFDDNDFTIYDISEKEKCHKFYILNSEINLTIVPFYTQNNNPYIEGTVSDNYISLLVQENVLDDASIEYKWYRNNEEINDSNISIYTITTDYEDADYYVEIIASNGETYKSEPINIKIDRR